MVRIITVQGMCQAYRVYWELIPAATIKALVLHLVQDLAWDSASADVRVAVVKVTISTVCIVFSVTCQWPGLRQNPYLSEGLLS